MRQLTNQDHSKMDRFIETVLDRYKAGHMDRTSAREDLTHVIAALDIGNVNEFRSFMSVYSESEVE